MSVVWHQMSSSDAESQLRDALGAPASKAAKDRGLLDNPTSMGYVGKTFTHRVFLVKTEGLWTVLFKGKELQVTPLHEADIVVAKSMVEAMEQMGSFPITDEGMVVTMKFGFNVLKPDLLCKLGVVSGDVT